MSVILFYFNVHTKLINMRCKIRSDGAEYKMLDIPIRGHKAKTCVSTQLHPVMSQHHVFCSITYAIHLMTTLYSTVLISLRAIHRLEALE